MKKVLALVLAVVLSFGALSVFAADGDKDVVDPEIVTFNAATITENTVLIGEGGVRHVVIPAAQFKLNAGAKAASVTGATSVKFFKPADATKIVKAEVDAAVAAYVDGTDTTHILVTFPAYTGTATSKQTVKGSFVFEKLNDNKKSRRVDVTAKYAVAGDFIDKVEQGEEFFITAEKGVVYQLEESAEGTVDFDGVELTLKKLAKGKRFNLTYTDTVPAALEAEYEWNNLDYFAITGATGVFGSWKLAFEGQEEATFVYGYVDGKLVKLPEGSVKWDKNDEVLTVTGTGAVPALVFSTTDLKVTATGTTAPTSSVANPGTGSSDMIGVAVVMAVVSLGAAGAVAFKKASK